MSNQLPSVWTDGITLPVFPKLKESTSTDVLIIGGGIAGILCAYSLQQMGIDYLPCEAATIGSGTTAGTTAVLSAQHSTLYTDLIKSLGEEKAKQYLMANKKALEQYRTLSTNFSFDFEERPSCIYSTDNRSLMEKEVQALRQLGVDAQFQTQIPLPIKIAGAVLFPGQAQMHPLKLLRELSKGLSIFEHTPIDRIDKTTAFSGKIQIKAKKIIVTSHFPIMNTHGFYFAKLYQKRSYVIALENAPDIQGTFVDNKQNGLYFRNYQNLLLIGGGDHRTGKHGGNFEEPRRFAGLHYPGATEKYAWATQDCMSLDGVPYIGAYSPSLPDVLVASGFNEWGMTSSMVAAEILCDMVTGKRSEYAAVFSPSRSVLKPQLFYNLGTTVMDFITPTTKRCPHLGCALKWNALEHSWDCPCHGSRFSESGELLNNPATGGLHEKKI